MLCSEATLAQLELANVPFPDWFVPGYLAKDVAEGYDGCWSVHDIEPTFKYGEWVSHGSSYEIGIDDTDGLTHTPAICRGLEPSESLIKIVPES